MCCEFKKKMKRNSNESNFPDCEDKYLFLCGRSVSKLYKPVQSGVIEKSTQNFSVLNFGLLSHSAEMM